MKTKLKIRAVAFMTAAALGRLSLSCTKQRATALKPIDQLTLIIWTNLTVPLDGQQTANTLFVKMLDHVYVVSPLR